MAEILLFHHAQGLTDGVKKFADKLRAGGHEVHSPDLLEGKTFTDINEAVAHVRAVGFEEIAERARREAAALPQALVYAGMSMGAGGAQELAQTRPGEGSPGRWTARSCSSTPATSISSRTAASRTTTRARPGS